MSDDLTRVIAEARQELDDMCPHAPDEHAEGTCDVCDFAFAADSVLDELGERLAPLIEGRVREAESRTRRQAETNVRWNLANLIGSTIDQGLLDGADGQRVAAAIRASTGPEEFAAACRGEEVRRERRYLRAFAEGLSLAERGAEQWEDADG